MTTHDEQTNSASTSTADAAPTRRESSSAGTEPSTTQTEPSATQTEPSAQADNPSSATTRTDARRAQGEPLAMADESSTLPTEPTDSENGASTAETEPPADKPLFAEGTLSGLRSRWDEVQAAFVDDPKECVQKADTLVAQVVEQLTTGFSEARSRLEAQWARGEDGSTEDLRVALKRYREFFQRLLSV
jgi:hypothetical protein